jgi:transcriptional regulator with XRE-family HTH domain
MNRHGTTYETFRDVSAQNRRLLRQEELILEVTEALAEAMTRQGITKAELARRLGKSKGFVSQVLAGDRNLTLRTIADISDALACRIRVQALSENDLRTVDLAKPLTTSAQPIRFAPKSSSRLSDGPRGTATG